MRTTVWATMTKKANDFYKTNWAFAFFMTTTTVFALIQVLLYSLNLMQVNGYYQDNAPNITLSWILLVASIFGTYCGFIGGIMLFRGSLSFVVWQNISTVMAVITQSLAHMWFGAITSLVFVGMNFTRFYVWKHKLIEKWNLSTAKVMTGSFIVFISILLITNAMVAGLGEQLYGASKWMKPYNRVFDATAASLNLTASLIMMFKVRWAFAVYALAKVFSITNYAGAGLIVPIVQMMLFWIMDLTGFIGWSIKEEER